MEEITMREKIMGVVRHVLTAAGGILIAKGIIDEAIAEIAVGAVINIIGFVWSWRAKD